MRLLKTIITAVSIVAVLPLSATSAHAELSSEVVRTWGVAELAPPVTTAIPAEVWAIEQIGNTIYVGGRFTEVIERRNDVDYDQPFLAAFDATSGDWIDWWRPDLDGSVFSLQASPDGSRLFVGGEFTEVNGHPMTSGLVALDPATGKLDPSFRASLDLFFSADPAVVRTMAIHGSWLYIGGSFTHVTSLPDLRRRSVAKVARLDLSDGEVDTGWKPQVAGGGVWGMAVSPNGSRVYLAGRFQSVNGAPDSAWFWTVNGTNGNTVTGLEPIHFNQNQRDQFDVVAVGSKVFLGGAQHYLQVLNASDLSLDQAFFTGTSPTNLTGGGDFQDLEVVGDRVYASCHCYASMWQGNQFLGDISGFAAFEADSGDFIATWPDTPPGSTGPWAILGAGDGCLWLGGDMSPAGLPRINSLVELCDEDGPGPAVGPPLQQPQADTTNPTRPGTATAVVVDDTDVEIEWGASSDASGIAHYNVYRNGNKIGETAGTSFRYTQRNPGTFTFQIRAVDPWGNQSTARIAPDLHVPAVPGMFVSLIQADFDSGSNGFSYVDDAFRGTSEPDYADGSHHSYAGYRYGGLQLDLGGVDDDDAFGMSGGFTRQFTLAHATAVELELKTLVVQSPDYEPDEYTEALLAIDGSIVPGGGPGGSITRVTDGGSSGWVVFTRDLGVLPAGSHTITIGGYNNKKTFANEFALVVFDDVSVAGAAPGVDVAEPDDGDTRAIGSVVPIRVGARDSRDSLGSLDVEVRIDGGPWIGTTWSPARLRYEYSWNSQSHAAGDVDVQARASDSDGNTTVSAVITFALGAAPATYDEVVAGNHPVAYWRLGEASGKKANDSSGNANHGRYKADIDLGHAGLIDDSDTSVHLDGSRARVRVPDSDDLNTGDPIVKYTIEAWIEVDDAQDGRQVIYEQGGRARGLSLYVRNGRVWGGAWNRSDNGGDTPWGSAWVKEKISSGVRHHVVLVFDRSKDKLRLYVDGERVGQARGIGKLHAHSANIAIGSIAGDTRFDNGAVKAKRGRYFQGVIDEVAVYRRALSKGTIAEHHSAGIG